MVRLTGSLMTASSERFIILQTYGDFTNFLFQADAAVKAVLRAYVDVGSFRYSFVTFKEPRCLLLWDKALRC